LHPINKLSRTTFS